MKCSKDGCDRLAERRGFCGKHYVSERRAGRLPPIPEFKCTGEICTVDGCGRPRKALGLCNKHWIRFRKHGDVNTVLLENGPNPLIGTICRHCGERPIKYRDFCERCYKKSEFARDSKHRARVKRRIGLRNVLVEKYTLEDVFIKSGGVCCICGLPVSTNFTDILLKPTIEHIIPIVLNGDDTLENVNLAHYSCNATKAHRELTEEQVKMLRERISLLQDGGKLK